MAFLIVGPTNTRQDLILETDLGQPLIGLPGMVTLFFNQSPVLQYFIGYSSAKHNTQNYLEAVSKCYHKYLSEYGRLDLLVHCHNWKSGTGKVIISDIIKITQPKQVIEYYEKCPQIESVLAENFSFLEGNYNKPKCEFNSVKVNEEKISDFKAVRSRAIMRYFNTASAEALCDIKPKVCFISDVSVRLNNEEIEKTLQKVIIGKLAGLCRATGECCGLGIVRDFNKESGMLYLVTPLEDLSEVEILSFYSGEGSISLQKSDIFNENLSSNFELNIPYVLPFVVLADQPNKYHPSRNLNK